MSLPLDTLTASEALRRMAEGDLTAEQLIRAVIGRIDRFEPSYNAFLFRNAKAVDEAVRLDRMRASGRKPGPLFGIPVAIKDAIDVRGFATTCAWSPLGPGGRLNLTPRRDATAVARLRGAGAIVIGKTNTPAFSASTRDAGTSWAGDSYNAVDRDLIASGSSTGTATAVAAGFALGGLGAETGGSLQNPAGAQSLVAVKPTFGLTPNSGLAPVATSTRDVIGPHARTIRDAALIMDVISGYSLEDPKTLASFDRMPANGYVAALRPDALQGARLGAYGLGWSGQPLAPSVLSAYEQRLGQLEALGAEVVPDPFEGTALRTLATPESPDLRGLETIQDDFDAYLRRNPGFGVATLRDLIDRAGSDPFAEGQPMYAMRRLQSDTPAGRARKLNAFLAAKRDYLAVIDSVMATARLDALVFPQHWSDVPTVGSGARFPGLTTPILNVAGLPGVVTPAGRLPSGSPFSLIFVGSPWSEARLLACAYAYEQAHPGRISPSLTVAGLAAGNDL